MRLRASQSTRSASPAAGQPSAIATTDVLMAVMHVYGEDFDRVLQVHGTDREELLQKLELDASAPEPG